MENSSPTKTVSALAEVVRWIRIVTRHATIQTVERNAANVGAGIVQLLERCAHRAHRRLLPARNEHYSVSLRRRDARLGHRQHRRAVEHDEIERAAQFGDEPAHVFGAEDFLWREA